MRNVIAVNDHGGARVRVSELPLRRRLSSLSRCDQTLVDASSSGKAVLLFDWRRNVALRASALSTTWDLWRRGSNWWVGTRERRAQPYSRLSVRRRTVRLVDVHLNCVDRVNDLFCP